MFTLLVASSSFVHPRVCAIVRSSFLALSRDVQDLYVVHLLHRTPLLKEQLVDGLYLLKRVGFYLRKIGASRKACYVELAKDAEHEREKSERIGRDAMTQHVDAYYTMQKVMVQLAESENTFANDLLDKVAEPMVSG